jgi:ABC-2 type transport system permease protein
MSPPLRSALVVAQWSVDQQLWTGRSLATALLAMAPIFVASAYRVLLLFDVTPPSAGWGVFSATTATVGFQFVLPMLALFYASGVVTDDVEAGTMRYFVTCPVSRVAFISGKMLGSLALTSILFLPPLVVSFYLILAPMGWTELGSRFPELAQDVLAATLGALAYNGVFAATGTLLKRPLLFGLFFVFGWQAAATFVPGVVRYLTVSHYLHALIPHDAIQGSFGTLLGDRGAPLTAVVALVVVAVATHAVTARAFRSKEV